MIGSEFAKVGRLYKRSGIGARVGFGTCPAVLVVDFQLAFTDPTCPVGGDLSDQIAATVPLLDVARRQKQSVAFTAVGFHESTKDGETWLRKMPGLAVLKEHSSWCEIDSRLARRPGEPIWIKRAPPAFFGTPLVSFLTAARVDTLIAAISRLARSTINDGKNQATAI